MNDQCPLRVLFVVTSMPIGGAETLLVNLVRGLDRKRFVPHIVCLKQLDQLGEMMARELPTGSNFLRHKFDVRVLPRLMRYLRQHRIHAVVTVGAGDKMFWGRLAARLNRTPVVISALHSTGWPDGIKRLNRCLTRWTDAFVAVAQAHGRYLVKSEGLPEHKVSVIPNGVDTHRFQGDPLAGEAVRGELGIPGDAPLVGIVAALRPEKNHPMFLDAADRIRQQLRDAQFLIVGDGEERPRLEAMLASRSTSESVHFLGARHDIPEVLSALDVLALTSHMEANPVSILEALSCRVPVVATRVGSVSESVVHGQTGYLVEPGDAADFASHVVTLLNHPESAERLGAAGRRLVQDRFSLQAMVEGYEQLISRLYLRSEHGRLTTDRLRQPMEPFAGMTEGQPVVQRSRS